MYTHTHGVPSPFESLLGFCKRPTLIPVFAKWEESKEDFHLCKTRQKVNLAFSVCFAGTNTEAAHIPSIESGTLLLYVSVILGSMCYLVWFDKSIWGSGNTKKCFHIN